MPSALHEVIIELFRDHPALAPELLREQLNVELPAFTDISVADAKLAELVPTEFRADLVVLLRDGRPVFAVVVEVQLARDEDKERSWPLYLATVRARHQCEACVLVVTPES